MKIGILTFHCTQNYGAILQAFALQKTIQLLGHDVEIIDYRPAFLLERYKTFDIKRITQSSLLFWGINLFKELLLLRRRYIKAYYFRYFSKNKLRISNQPIFTNQNINTPYDIIIVGSDQVWNTKITKGFNPYYWGEYKNDKTTKIISYAASMEVIEISKDISSEIQKRLLNFSNISVREDILQTLLQPLTNKKISKVADPTLLLEKQEWSLIHKIPKFKKKYVLVYHVRWNNNSIRIANQIANQIDAEVVQLSIGLRVLYRKNVYQCASPEEFLGWIHNASCVITTSFHGTIFSALYEVPFYSLLLSDGRDSRIVSLLHELNLEDRLISKDDSPTFSPINYAIAKEKIQFLRTNSLTFLQNSLQ